MVFISRGQYQYDPLIDVKLTAVDALMAAYRSIDLEDFLAYWPTTSSSFYPEAHM